MTRNLKFFSLLFMTAMKNRVENQWSAKSLPSIFLILLLILFGCEHGFSREVDSDRVLIMIISRPIEKKNELIPNNAQGARHLAIFSDILPHGVWEAGPGLSGMIETTGTVDNLVEWSTHRITQKCAEMGGEYLYSASAEVNKKSLLDSIRLYESTIAKKQKYDYYSYNENFAVESIVYGAGVDLSKTITQAGMPITKNVRSQFKVHGK